MQKREYLYVVDSCSVIVNGSPDSEGKKGVSGSKKGAVDDGSPPGSQNKRGLPAF